MSEGPYIYNFKRSTYGCDKYKNVYKHSFGYTDLGEPAAASATAIHAAITGSTSAQTITTSITDPDCPRALVVTPGGTTGDVAAATVIITGTNVEGKTITENFTFTANASSAINGIKAFKTVTSIYIPVQDGTACTFSIGTQNKFGTNHRLYPNKTNLQIAVDGVLESSSAANYNEVEIEKNLVTPTTTPTNAKEMRLYYSYHHWSVGDLNDIPKYSTSTSTSTSSSSTSTSSTSSSTSSTSSSTSSTSTSSTSSSTSSSSTSTTTTP